VGGKKLPDLSPESRKVVNWFDRNRGASAIHKNSKTGLSIDYSTSCPKRLDPLKGPCPYCYVEHGRLSDKLYNMKGANKRPDIDNPYNHEIRNFPDDLVKELNKDGGIRMFSFGDYRPDADFENVTKTLADAKERGLHVKAITKQPEFVKAFGDHSNLTINVSIDNVPRTMSKNAPTIKQALKLKAGRENIKIRAVALNPEEAVRFGDDPNINVVTLYHGLTNFNPKGERHNKLLKIITEQNPELVRRVGVEKLQKYTDTWVNMGPRNNNFKELAKKYPRKICCQGGKCSRDKTKCGLGYASMLVAGVLLPEIKEE